VSRSRKVGGFKEGKKNENCPKRVTGIILFFKKGELARKEKRPFVVTARKDSRFERGRSNS